MTEEQTPIDRKWLKSIGGEQGGLHGDHPDKITFYRGENMAIGLWHVDDGWKAMLLVTEAHALCIVRGLKTRGDWRQLAKPLGIELTEASQ